MTSSMGTIDIAMSISDDVIKEGGNVYYVGGCVRDQLLGTIPKDRDIEVYGVEFNELLGIVSKYGKATLCGESFGVIKIGDLDIAVPRRETSTGRSHKTIEVDSDPFIKPEVACRRRDFTINSMLQDVMSGEILDFHGGREDLRAGIIRATDQYTFMEDPLRLLRAVKFAARLGFIIEKDTADLIRRNVGDVYNLSNERVFGEISDILMKAPKPSYGFRLMDLLGILEHLLPEIWMLSEVDQNGEYHPEGDVFTHTMGVIDYEPVETRTIEEQFARLYHDVGKIHGTKCHNITSMDIVRQVFPRRLTTDTKFIDEVANLVLNHMNLYDGEATRRRVKRLVVNTNVPKIVRMFRADKFSRGLSDDIIKQDEDFLSQILEIYEEVQNEVDPLILGRHIMMVAPDIPPGPIYGKILDRVYQMQLDDEFTTQEEGLDVLKNIIEEIL